VDIPFYYVILSSMNIILFSFHSGNLLTSSNLTAVVRTAAFTHCGSEADALSHTRYNISSFLSGPLYRWLRSSHDPLHLCAFFWIHTSSEQQRFLLLHFHDGETRACQLQRFSSFSLWQTAVLMSVLVVFTDLRGVSHHGPAVERLP